MGQFDNEGRAVLKSAIRALGLSGAFPDPFREGHAITVEAIMAVDGDDAAIAAALGSEILQALATLPATTAALLWAEAIAGPYLVGEWPALQGQWRLVAFAAGAAADRVEACLGAGDHEGASFHWDEAMASIAHTDRSLRAVWGARGEARGKSPLTRYKRAWKSLSAMLPRDP